MSRFTNNPAIYNQAIGLSETEMQKPMEVIKHFFTEHQLSDIRDTQDQIKRICLRAEKGIFGRPEGRTKLLDYFDQLTRLFESALLLSQSVNPVATSPRVAAEPKEAALRGNLDPRIADLVRGVNEILVDVAHLCVVVVKAWTEKMREDLKLPHDRSKGVVRSSRLGWVDLNTLQSMALILQNKLTKLSALAVDMMISETSHLLNQPS